MDLKRKQEAQSHYDAGTRILKNLPKSSSILQDLEEAVKHLQKATVLNPNFAFAFHNLAHAWYSVAEYNVASAELQGFRVNPKEAEENRIGALVRGLKAVDQAIAIQQQFPQAHNTRAMILAKLLRLDEARKAVETALLQNPEYENAIDNRGKIIEMIKEKAKTPGYKNENDFRKKINQELKEQSDLWRKLWKK